MKYQTRRSASWTNVALGAFGVALVAALLAVILAFASDAPPSARCVDYDTRVVSTTTFVNGKPRPGTRVETYCDEWAAPDEED